MYIPKVAAEQCPQPSAQAQRQTKRSADVPPCAASLRPPPPLPPLPPSPHFFAPARHQKHRGCAHPPAEAEGWEATHALAASPQRLQRQR
jgi:hypothetical protein